MTPWWLAAVQVKNPAASILTKMKRLHVEMQKEKEEEKKRVGRGREQHLDVHMAAAHRPRGDKEDVFL
ncbi:unnamed protein product [Pleuronectes platessa]|uniref:Uncharacterized protein n=1 Tax=Pleuronectes platessa TaxID=8262 RepID=A0A9N7USW1_PLEPL|nr:unnamed protein product [Pleuronectes platessa]